jgi:uncharacterized protein DUF6924
MPTLPSANYLSALLVRTDFSSDEAWQQVCDEAQREYDEGFSADLVLVSDPAFGGASWQAVRAAVPASDHGPAVLFVADEVTLRSLDHPVLVVDLLHEGHTPIRCIPPELWSVENNLNIANMSWDEFADALEYDGVFRGFPEA